jgi:hypothetical protein
LYGVGLENETRRDSILSALICFRRRGVQEDELHASSH